MDKEEEKKGRKEGKREERKRREGGRKTREIGKARQGIAHGLDMQHGRSQGGREVKEDHRSRKKRTNDHTKVGTLAPERSRWTKQELRRQEDALLGRGDQYLGV